MTQTAAAAKTALQRIAWKYNLVQEGLNAPIIDRSDQHIQRQNIAIGEMVGILHTWAVLHGITIQEARQRLEDEAQQQAERGWEARGYCRKCDLYGDRGACPMCGNTDLEM